MRKLLRSEKGQAAVETLFSIPIFMILFLIGFQLFCITWNSQYAQVRSRYDAIHQANHMACPQAGKTGKSVGEADVSADARMLANSPSTRPIKNYSYIVCK